MSYQPKVYKEQGGNRLVIADGGYLKVGSIDIPHNVNISAAAGAANISVVTYQVVDGNNNNVTAPYHLDVFLSDSANGANYTGTGASGAVQSEGNGIDLATLSSKKGLRVQTTETGLYKLSITDTAKTHFYPCATHPLTGRVIAGAQMSNASYG